MVKEKIDISVIIPVYNVERYIEKCINSILIQTGPTFEIIVINDGSTDGSLSIVKNIVDERIIIINKENTGVSDSRNIGIENAKGKYVCFVDSDDFIESDYFVEIFSHLKQNKDLYVFDYFLDTLNKRQHVLKIEKKSLPVFELGNIDSILPNLGYIWNKIYKLELLKTHSIRFRTDIALYEDIIFNTAYFVVSKTIQNSQLSFYHYLNRPTTSLVKRYDSNGLTSIIEMNKSIEHFLVMGQLEKEKINSLLSNYCMLGMKHQINTLFKYQHVTLVNKFDELKYLISNIYIVSTLDYFKPTSISDKIYKYCVSNSKCYLLYVICKIIK